MHPGTNGASTRFPPAPSPEPDSWVAAPEAPSFAGPPSLAPDGSWGEAPPPCFPECGESFLGFRLVAELGRGAFGRVYLARQDDLAQRLVALKVSTEVQTESHN